MKGPLRYLLYGLAVLGLLGVAEYRGWSLLSTREARAAAAGAPQSVRDNPGGSRPLYYGSGRYRGGK